MKRYTFRVEFTDDVEAESEEEARREFLNMVDDLGVSNYLIPKDLELVKVEDMEGEE